ncbi:hypothetical protein [uncultured Aeromicrobium sp.]|uniref:glycosyl-4,4'-diaponeurosporenoate acyltransferase CrtO family protein n=1 Tax=uncultured Aeromicrobium sp. TaxID=337820 RepID=UPI0025E2BDFB|nr:hypothetical protein [uncultured Aeromicrobium sp.]
MTTPQEETQESKRGAVVSGALGLAIAATLAFAGWHAIGPDHLVYAVTVQGTFVFMGLLVGPLCVDRARGRYVVARFEPRLYTLLGAELVRRALGALGWNRVIGALREHGEGHDKHERLVRGTELSETGHALGGSATLLLAVIALLGGYFPGAAKMTLVGLVVHGYPIMIQRMVRYRVQHRSQH